MKVKISMLMIFFILLLIIGSCVVFILIDNEPDNQDDKVEFVIEQQNLGIEPFSFPLPDNVILSITSNQDTRSAFTEDEAGFSTNGKWHNGIDIACKEKTPILAAKQGIVYTVYPSYDNGTKYKGHPVYGGLVIIYHPDKTITLYGHLRRTDVIEGEWVERGQQIGLSGGRKGRRGSGISTGSHLHFLATFKITDFFEDYF